MCRERKGEKISESGEKVWCLRTSHMEMELGLSMANQPGKFPGLKIIKSGFFFLILPHANHKFLDKLTHNPIGGSKRLL